MPEQQRLSISSKSQCTSTWLLSALGRSPHKLALTPDGNSSELRRVFFCFLAINTTSKHERVPHDPTTMNSMMAFTTSIPLPLRCRPPLVSRHRTISPRICSAILASEPQNNPKDGKAALPSVTNQDFRDRPTTTDSDWMFYDVARVLVKGGQGGNGCVAFRREKGIPRGGPAGGTGGSGGSIEFIANAGANTLARFRGGAAFRAADGANGVGKGRHGACVRPIRVSVPLGTVIRDDEGRILADLSDEGQVFQAARGGRGGRGNLAFKTDRNRAPRIAEQGEPGVERWLRLELKLVADVALVGFPNAGKSTALDSVSNARPKIADYPFTTIVPNLGVVDGVDGADGLVLADVPGLVEGAHRGVGMGVSFLRHVERCKVVVHLLDGTADDVIERYRAIRLELELFDERLARKKEVVLFNKMDLPEVKEKWENGLREELVEAVGVHKRIAAVSAKSKKGLADVMRRLIQLVESVGDDDNIVVLGDEEELGLKAVTVEKVRSGVFQIGGYKVEKAYKMTNWDYTEGIDRFQRILAALGVNQRLIHAGAVDGDSVICFDREFDYFKEENIYSAAAALDGYSD